MGLADLIEQLGSRKPSASEQEVWASLVEHFKTSGGDIDAAEAALREALDSIELAQQALPGIENIEILFRSAATHILWPEAPADGYFESAQDLAVGLVETGLAAGNELASWCLSLDPELNYLLLGLAANPRVSEKNIMKIVDRVSLDPILATALMHPSLTMAQIEQIFHKLKDPVWLVNAINKQEGFEIPQYQWPFKVAGKELEQSKYLWEEILESITQFLTSGEDQFELFEGFMEEVEESSGFSDEVMNFIKSDPYLLSLARACGWEYLESLLEE
jgi:hypothetical protein